MANHIILACRSGTTFHEPSFHRCTAIMFLSLFFIALFLSSPIPGSSSQKKILALYKSNENATGSNNPARLFLSDSLRTLGYEVDYRDALGNLPGPREMEQYHAVVTFFTTPLHPGARSYLKWLKEQISQGRKVVFIGNLGAHTEDGKTWLSIQELSEFLFPFGVSYKGTTKVDPSSLTIARIDSEVMRSRPKKLPELYMRFDSLYEENKSYLTISQFNQKETESAVVVRTPFGGMAQIDFLYDKTPEISNWYLDRLSFLRDVLGHKSPHRPPMKRIAGFFKGSENETIENNFIRRFLSGPLFKLGYMLDCFDIEAGLPDEKTIDGYHGIVTWYKGAVMKNAPQYCLWLAGEMRRGKRIIIMGNFGAYAEPVESGAVTSTRFLSDREINSFFYPFGLLMGQQWTTSSELINLDFIDKEFMSGDLLKRKEDFKNYFLFKSISPENIPYLTLSRRDIAGSRSDVVVKTPHGGMALETYIYEQDPKTWDTKYRLDLDKFLAQCLREGKSTPVSMSTLQQGTSALKMNAKARYSPVPAPQQEPIPRKILVLYKSSEIDDFWEDPFYNFSGPILNYLGFSADYTDIEREKPDDETMKDYLGIISWFSNSAMVNAKDYGRWLLHQVEKGRKIIIFGDYGAFYEKENFRFEPISEELFRRLGSELKSEHLTLEENLKYLKNDLITSRSPSIAGPYTMAFEFGRPDCLHAFYGYDIDITKKESRFFDFEAPLKIMETTYVAPIKSYDIRNRILLSLNGRDTGEITPVVTGNWGGFVMGDFFYLMNAPGFLGEKRGIRKYRDLLDTRYDPRLAKEKDNGKWVINPFAFLEDALGVSELPRLDYTTLNGQRILYSHIDGDGLTQKSLIDPSKYGGEIILEEILKRYDIPITASIITEDLSKNSSEYYNYPLDMARRIFSLDNIEIATHTHTHPFDMKRGDLNIKILKEKGPKEYIESYEKPSPDEQILYSTALINNNAAPEGKKTEVVLWPGKCQPTEEMLKEAESLGLANMNGGNPLFDSENNSYSNLYPILSRVGSCIQVHTSGSNDYIYTKSWTGDPGGMIRLIETIKNTGEPLRISPINIYSHFNSGVYRESLDALRKVYDYVMDCRVAPLFTGQYCDIVRDFYDSIMGRTADGGFWIHNMGYLRTVRFDRTSRKVDLDRSQNIIGYDRFNDSLYVFLDEEKEHRVYLTDRQQSRVYLKSASHYINDWQADSGRIRALLKGIGKGAISIANLDAGGSYRARLAGLDLRLKADERGILEFNYELKGKQEDFRLEIDRE